MQKSQIFVADGMKVIDMGEGTGDHRRVGVGGDIVYRRSWHGRRKCMEGAFWSILNTWRWRGLADEPRDLVAAVEDGVSRRFRTKSSIRSMWG